MVQERKIELLRYYKEMDSNQLRQLLIEKEDSLDKFSMMLHRMYGLEIPQSDYDEVMEKREEIKCIETVILQRFKAMEIK